MGGIDAIAVGGGLAGAAFALALARRGGRVTLIERKQSAEHKVCGDFLSFEAQEVLADLGVDLIALGARPAATLRLVSGTRTAIAPLPFTGLAVSRKALDEALLGAAERAGARVMRGETAAAMERAPNGVSVRVGNRLIAADTAVLATGKHNMRGLPRRRAGRTALKMVFEPAGGAARDLGGVVQLAGYHGGYAGACLVEGGALSVCWLTSGRMLEDAGHDWPGQLGWIARRSPAVGDLISNARPLISRPIAVSALPFGYRRRQAVAPNIYAVGDQLAVIHPFTGDGTSIALMSGVAAAEAVAEGQSAQRFQDDFHRQVGTQMRWAALVDTAFAFAAGRWAGVRTIAAFPAVATLLASATRARLPAARLYRPVRLEHFTVSLKR